MKLDLMLLKSVLTMLLQIESFSKIFFNGAWKASISNKYTDGKIFLIFDPTHIIKNIYNNLVNRRVFEMPCMTRVAIRLVLAGTVPFLGLGPGVPPS